MDWSLCSGGLITGPDLSAQGCLCTSVLSPVMGLHGSADILVPDRVGGLCGDPPPAPSLTPLPPTPPPLCRGGGRGALCEPRLRLQLCLGLSWCRKVLCAGSAWTPWGEGSGCVDGWALEPAQAAVCSRVREQSAAMERVGRSLLSWFGGAVCTVSSDTGTSASAQEVETGPRRPRCLWHVTWQLLACCCLVTKIVCVRKFFQIGKRWINHHLSCPVLFLGMFTLTGVLQNTFRVAGAGSDLGTRRLLLFFNVIGIVL